MSQSSFLSLIGLAEIKVQHDAHVAALQRELKRIKDEPAVVKYCDNWFASLGGQFKPKHLQPQ